MKKAKILNYLLGLILWLFSIVILYPLLMVVMTSFKPLGEASQLSIRLPTEWHFENYAEVWRTGKIGTSFINSTMITVCSVVIVIFMSSMLSYIVVRRKNKFTTFVSRFLTMGIIAPFAALPTIQLLKMIGLYGTRGSLILVYGAIYLPFSTMLYSSFIHGLPKEMDEAAVMDGCRGFSLYRLIIFPLLKPITATVAILNFMWVWNDFQYPLYLLNSSSKWTLPISVYSFFGTFERSWNLVCADMILVSAPVVIIYLFMQRFIIEGMTAGAVKG